MLKNLKTLLGVIVITGLYIAIYSCATTNVESDQRKVKLTSNLEKGKVYRYQMTQDIAMGINNIPDMPMGEMKVTAKIITVISEKVIDFDENGTATIECTFEVFKIEGDNPMSGKVSLDSTKKEDMEKFDKNAPGFFLLGQTFNSKITKEGKVVEIIGFDKILEKIGEKNASVAWSLKNTFSAEQIKVILQRYHAQVPMTAIGVSESWETTEEFSMSGIGSYAGKIKNTYIGKETLNNKECAKIDNQYDIKISMDQNSPITQMFDMIWESTPMSGILYLRLKDGIIVKQEAVAEMKCKLKPKIGDKNSEESGRNAMPKEMSMTMKMTLKNELID